MANKVHYPQEDSLIKWVKEHGGITDWAMIRAVEVEKSVNSLTIIKVELIAQENPRPTSCCRLKNCPIKQE